MGSPAEAWVALRGPTCSVSDINECRRYPGRLCGHKCENTPGSYYCSCSVGFRLSADGRSCEGEAAWAPGRLIDSLLPEKPRLHPQTPSVGTDLSLFPKRRLSEASVGETPVTGDVSEMPGPPGSRSARWHLPRATHVGNG